MTNWPMNSQIPAEGWASALVLAGWPRLVMNDRSDVDLNQRPEGRGCWVLGHADGEDGDVLTLHLPREWGADLSATVEVVDGQLGETLVWAEDDEDPDNREPLQIAWFHRWPGLPLLHQLAARLLKEPCR